jgi:aldose 1-epimerase
MKIVKEHWGNHNQHEVYLLTMDNDYMKVAISNFGCTIVSVLFPDGSGHMKNLVLGYDNLESYVSDRFYLGCIVGRFANRMSKAAFYLGGKKYHLTQNEKGTTNHLHGGEYGFNKKVFAIKHTLCKQDACSIELYYMSKDGEEGYPGNLDLTVTYTLTANNELRIDYQATTDRMTPVNLTNHSYFNLSGRPISAMDHELCINADYTLMFDAQYIPTGQLQAIADTSLDFKRWRSIQDGLKTRGAAGYNHYFIFSPVNANMGAQAALRHPASGTFMTVETSYPGMMLYTADYLEQPFIKQQGTCLETHLYPDSPNRPEFPQAFLLPGDTYNYFTTYRFYNVPVI